LKKELLHELAATDDEELIDELLADDPRVEPADKYDVAALRDGVQADRNLLEALGKKARRVRPDQDPKLAALAEELIEIARQAKSEAIDDDDERRKRKVLVFSSYADTIDWIESYLDRKLDKEPNLACYRGRMASVAGNESRHGVTREHAVHGFAPESSGAPPGERADRFDLLLSTDVLAEGMNLQQCRNIINFDLPWNPMRLVQRHGRIDRIGSRHPAVYLRTFFPDEELDRLLNLEERVRRKLAQAARSVGVETTPIEHGEEGQQSFSETREEIEKLHRGDATIYEQGGTASAAQTGEEYRQELRKALARRGDEITGLPWKAGSGLRKGTRRGHFFCAVCGERTYLRFVPRDEQEPIEHEIGTCLRMIECQEDSPLEMPLDLKQTAFSAWEHARQHIFRAWMHETDPKNLQPKVSRFCRELAAYLREHPPIDIAQARLERGLEAIESPLSRRDEAELRDVFNADFETNQARSRAVVEAAERLGLEPFHAPPALPPIAPDDVHLVCWMALVAGDGAT
jgi:hypothetical protein